MSAHMLLSLFVGIFCGIASYLVFLLLHFEQPFLWALIACVGMALLMFPVLVFLDHMQTRQYRKYEAHFPDPILLTANGNIKPGNKLRNANLYFFDTKLMFLSLDGKPYLSLELPYDLIDRFEIHALDVLIYTKDDRFYSIKTPDAAEIVNVLRQLNLIL